MATSDNVRDGNAPESPQQFAADVALLIRHELELAKSELAAKAKSAGIGMGMLSASGVTGVVTVGCFTALLIVALSLVIPSWAAVLAITLLWAAITATLALAGKRKVEEATPFVPEQTIENLKEDVAWARRGGK
jgi:hypothetical protein